MNKPCQLLTAVVFAAFLPRAYSAHAQLLSPTAAPEQNWVSLAASADGTRLAAVGSYGWLYLSSDSGSNWSPAATAPGRSEPQRPWTGLASSADGLELLAVANFTPIFCSTNGGTNWTQAGPTAVWSCAALAANGKMWVAGDHNDGFIYLSRDQGKTWAPSSAPARRWRSLAASADGSNLFAAADYGTNYAQVPSLYCSTNSGDTWTMCDVPALPWQALGTSADGNRVFIGAYGGPVFVSTNAGSHWTQANLPDSRWSALALSGDATRVIAASADGLIYISNDGGTTWSKANAPVASWQTLACSSDGLRLFAGAWSDPAGGIYSAQLPPKLDIVVSSAQLIISWPDSVEGFALEQSADVSTQDWQPVGLQPILANGRNQVVIESPTGTSTFRLVRRQP